MLAALAQAGNFNSFIIDTEAVLIGVMGNGFSDGRCFDFNGDAAIPAQQELADVRVRRKAAANKGILRGDAVYQPLRQ